MKLLKKIFNRTKLITPKFNTSCEVLWINEDSKSLHEQFGISEQRRLELDDILRKAIGTFEDSKSNAQIISEASKLCKHPNELALISFSLGYCCSPKFFAFQKL